MNLKRLLLLLPLLALGAAPRAAFRLEDVLSERTLLFAETPSAPAFREAFSKTPLAKFFEDEEVRAFAADAFSSAVQTLSSLSGVFDKNLTWDQTLGNVSGQIAIAMPSLGAGEKKGPDFVMTFDCAGHGDAQKKAIEILRKKFEEQPGRKAEAWKAGAVDVLSFPLQPDFSLHVAVAGETVILATWKGTMEALAGGAVQAAPLAKSATFLKAREKSGAKELFFYADVAGFVKEARENLEEPQRKIIGALGLDGFTYAAGGLSIAETGVRERFFLGTTGERKGLARFLSLKGPAAGYETAPQDALQFVSFSIALPELYDTFFEILRTADEFQQQQIQDQIAEFEKEVGFSIKNDLFAAFGSRVWWYSALPPDSLLPDGITGLEIRDAARFDKCLQAVVKRLGVELGELDFKGKKINYFRFAAPSGPDPARMFLSTLYFIREGDKLLVSSLIGGFGAANGLKRHILRQEKPTLATQPSLVRWTGGKAGDASMVMYVDLGRAFTTYYNTLGPLTAFFRESLRADGKGVDLLKLPLGETIGKYLGQSVSQVTVEADGLRVDGLSGSGTTLMTVVYVGAAGIVLYPAISHANEENKLGQCRSQSSSIYFAVLNHLEEKKKYPEKTGGEFFKQLKELNYLPEEPTCPISGGAYRGPAKDLNTLGDVDVIFCDEPGNHGDGSIIVLRRNGSTATLRPADPEYQKALETTKGK